MDGEFAPAVERLEAWCTSKGLPWPPGVGEKFARMIGLLLRYQAQTNLTGFDGADGIVDGMILDSLQVLRLGGMRGPVVDVGSGAGFPGVPIKLLRPDLEMILVEPRRRRYAFLRKLESELGLEGLDIWCARIESVSLPETIGGAISKAFLPLMAWVDLCEPWARAGADVWCLTTRRCWEESLIQLQGKGYRSTGMVEENGRVYVRLRMA